MNKLEIDKTHNKTENLKQIKWHILEKVKDS